MYIITVNAHKIYSITPIYQMRKLMFKMAEWLPNVTHLRKWPGHNSNPDAINSTSCCFTSIPNTLNASQTACVSNVLWTNKTWI